MYVLRRFPSYGAWTSVTVLSGQGRQPHELSTHYARPRAAKASCLRSCFECHGEHSDELARYQKMIERLTKAGAGRTYRASSATKGDVMRLFMG
jgi:cytochrome c553